MRKKVRDNLRHANMGRKLEEQFQKEFPEAQEFLYPSKSLAFMMEKLEEKQKRSMNQDEIDQMQ